MFGLELWNSELTRHISVDGTDVHADHLCSLLAEPGPQPVRQSPRGGLGSTIGSGRGKCYPTQNREEVDDSPAAILRQDRSKGATEIERTEVVSLHFGPCSFNRIRRQKARIKRNTRVVDEQVHVPTRP